MPACFMIVLICNGRIPKISSSFINLKIPPHFGIIQIYVMEGVFMNVILFFLLIIWCDLIKGSVTEEEYMQKLDKFVTQKTNIVKQNNFQYQLRQSFDQIAPYYQKKK